MDRIPAVADDTSDNAIPAHDPFAIFEAWFAEAKVSEPNDPNAMALATATPGAAPSVRMVLLKGHGPDGFVFYTNFESRKGGELAANPQVALLFHWKSLRQASADRRHDQGSDGGRGRRLFRQSSSQIATWLRGIGPIAPATLARSVHGACGGTAGKVSRWLGASPAHWSGYRVTPHAIEFWQDREYRLHERRRFTRFDSGEWTSSLLYP
jgi:pyridoxamine 5'-phosphate oxidase